MLHKLVETETQREQFSSTVFLPSVCIPSNEQAFQKSWEKLTDYFEH